MKPTDNDTASQTGAANTTLGMNVLFAREREGLTQSDAAKRIGISITWLCRIEGDYTNPSVATLLRLAKGLGTTAAELLRGVKE